MLPYAKRHHVQIRITKCVSISMLNIMEQKNQAFQVGWNNNAKNVS